MVFAGESPEKVGLGIELKIFSLDVDVKLRCSGVGNTDNHSKEIAILTQFKRRCYHDCTRQRTAVKLEKHKQLFRHLKLRGSKFIQQGLTDSTLQI